MKVAVLFSGQLRTFGACAENIQRHLIRPLEEQIGQVDVFAHFWPSEDEVLIKQFSDFFKPVKIDRTPQPQLQFPTEDQYPNVHVGIGSGTTGPLAARHDMHFRLQCQWFGIQCVFKCMLQHLEETDSVPYHLVVRARPDAMYKTTLQIPKSMLTLESQNKIMVGPDHRVYVDKQPTNVNNCFAYGTLNNMKAYALYYDQIPRVLQAVNDMPKAEPLTMIKQRYGLNSYFVYYITKMCGISFEECRDFATYLYRSNGVWVPMRK